MKKSLLLAVLVPLISIIFVACNKKSSNPELFVYVTVDEENARHLFPAFEKETGIDVRFVRLSTGEATARIEAEKNNPQASIWIGGAALAHSELKQKGLTTPYDPVAAKSIPAKFKDPEHYWTGIYVGVLAFAVNPENLKKKNLQPPTSWKSLTEPQWKGLIEMANPGSSGTSYNLVTSMIAKDGESKAFDYFKELSKNVSQYTRSGEAPIKDVALGESLVGIGYDHDIRRMIRESKAPLEIIYPADGAGYEVASLSLIKGGAQTEAAKKLAEWMFSPEATQILTDHSVHTLISAKAPLSVGALPPANFHLIDTDAAWAGKNKKRILEEWNEKIKG